MKFLHNNAPSDTPLVAVFDKGKNHIIRGEKITAAIHSIIRTASTEVRFNLYDDSSHYLRAGGAMALILVQANTNTTHLVCRWQIDIMIHHLHTAAKSFTQGLVVHMGQYGTYALVTPEKARH